jgi:hypothetical protein
VKGAIQNSPQRHEGHEDAQSAFWFFVPFAPLSGELVSLRAGGHACVRLHIDLGLESKIPGGNAMARPLIVIDPQPRGLREIFDADLWARLQSLGELAVHEGSGRMPAERFEPLLPEMALLIGQSDMPKARLDRAPKLRAIVNVETNFLRTSITRRALNAAFVFSLRVPPSPSRSPK